MMSINVVGLIGLAVGSVAMADTSITSLTRLEKKAIICAESKLVRAVDPEGKVVSVSKASLRDGLSFANRLQRFQSERLTLGSNATDAELKRLDDRLYVLSWNTKDYDYASRMPVLSAYNQCFNSPSYKLDESKTLEELRTNNSMLLADSAPWSGGGEGNELLDRFENGE